MTTMSLNEHELYDKISLDAVTGHILDDLQDPAPHFLLSCTRNVEKSIEEYTKHIVCQIQADGACDISSMPEDHIGDLLDSICESNQIYFQTGMKMGAALLKQLLDL